MIHKITGKQHNSKLCFVCGLKNRFGIHAHFYITESEELIAVFTPSEEHQSYPGRLQERLYFLIETSRSFPAACGG